MEVCNKGLTAFQRRPMQLIGSMMGTCVALSVALQILFEHHRFSRATYFGVALLAAVPIAGTLIVIARYLQGEKDEYLRNIVVQAILWGFGLVMVADTFLGYVVEYQPVRFAFGIINMDIFVITGMIAVRIQLWRNR